MKLGRPICALLLSVFLLGGCAGGRVYDSNIKHVCLCAVRTARAHGYVITGQEFHESSGEMVATISSPDPRREKVRRGFFKRMGEFFWNAWEHTRLEWSDSEARRERREERIVARIRASTGGLFGWLSWHAEKSATVKLTVDVTDYAKRDWIIRRDDREKPFRDGLYADIGDCLAGKRIARTVPAPAFSGTVLVASAEREAPRTQPVEPVRTVAAVPAPRPEVEQAAAPTAIDAPVGESEVKMMLDRGRQAFEAGKYSEAVGPLEAVLKAEPGNAGALGYLGASYAQLNRTADAIAAYERYMELVPGDYRTREYLEELKRK